MRLVKEIFAPVRTKNLDQLGAAVESWEGHVQDFEITGQRLGPILKTFGLMQLVPDAMEEDLLKFRQQLTNYSKVKGWIMDQIATRTKIKRAEVNEIKNDAPEAPTEPTNEELLAFWNSKGAGKGGNDKPKFKGDCFNCGKDRSLS